MEHPYFSLMLTGKFPAPAGINRKSIAGDLIAGRVPRASGDKPPLMIVVQKMLLSSPC